MIERGFPEEIQNLFKAIEETARNAAQQVSPIQSLYEMIVGLMAYQVHTMTMCGADSAIETVKGVIARNYVTEQPSAKQVFEIIRKSIEEFH